MMESFGIMTLSFKDWEEKEQSSKGIKNEWLIRGEGRRNENLDHENQRRKWLVTNVHQSVQCYNKIAETG